MNEDEEEKEKTPTGDLSTDVLDAALGDDYIEIDEEIIIESYEDEESVDIAFSQDDPRDWY